MKAFAPGKMLLSGAYAVLRGAPAVVLAVSRGAVADTRRDATHVSDELRAALAKMRAPAPNAPHVAVDALFEGDKKLGLGASAAGLVAALGALSRLAHEDLRAEPTRAALFRAAREAHAAAQSGGSGVDVAASVYGGLLAYSLDEVSFAPPRVEPLVYPKDLVIEAFFAGKSASTRELRARVDALAVRDSATFSTLMEDLSRASMDARAAIVRGDVRAFTFAVRAQVQGLSALGREADAPIVLPSFVELDGLALATAGVFTGSGAGGGDVALYMGARPSSPELRDRAAELGLTSFSFERDTLGLRSID